MCKCVIDIGVRDFYFFFLLQQVVKISIVGGRISQCGVGKRECCDQILDLQ